MARRFDMYRNMHCEGGFEDIRKAAEGFGEFIRKMAEEVGPEFDLHLNRGCGPERPFGPDRPFEFAEHFFPRHNVYRNAEDALVYEFLLPGFDESGINLSFKGDLMILKAKMPAGASDEGRRYDRRRFSPRDIDRREYSVPADRYDQEKAKAVFKNGILTVTIPEKDSGGGNGGIKVEIVKEGN
jgi:HSP20 family protein